MCALQPADKICGQGHRRPAACWSGALAALSIIGWQLRASGSCALRQDSLCLAVPHLSAHTAPHLPVGALLGLEQLAPRTPGPGRSFLQLSLHQRGLVVVLRWPKAVQCLALASPGPGFQPRPLAALRLGGSFRGSEKGLS